MSRWFKNYDQIATTKQRKDILAIAEAGLDAIDTEAVIKNKIKLSGKILTIADKQFDLNQFKRIKVIGFGKVSCKAAFALEKILGNLIHSGIAIGIAPTACEIIQTYKGTHPSPSYGNVDISKQILETSQDTKEDDLVIVIVSGGGSALLCWPKTECDQGQMLYHQFLKTGGTIEELNTIRKHISFLKGGGLAKILYPATVIGLIFSDVPGDNYEMIASGPTYKDASTVDDAKAIIKKYELNNFDLTETPKDDKYFEKVTNIPLVSNSDALVAMKLKGEELGYISKIISDKAYEESQKIVDQLISQNSNKTLILAGGEPQVKVIEGGNGGRNLYASMIALNKISDKQTFLSLASDGADNSDSAGAIADAQTLNKIKSANLNLAENIEKLQGYKFFEQLQELLFTGPTQANVSDLLMLVSD